MAKRTGNSLEFLNWPTMAWIAGWSLMSPGRTDTPMQNKPRTRNKQSLRRTRKAETLCHANVVRFPLERVAPRAKTIDGAVEAQIIKLRSA